MAMFWTVCRYLGLAILVIIVVSMLVGSGFCAGAKQHADRTTFVQSGRSVADIHVDAAPGADIDATVHIGKNSANPTTGRPAWRVNWQLCQDHFIYDLGQSPAGRCDHLSGESVTAAPAPKARAVARRPRPAPCPPCDN
jgi:hypothetical protein